MDWQQLYNQIRFERKNWTLFVRKVVAVLCKDCATPSLWNADPLRVLYSWPHVVYFFNFGLKFKWIALKHEPQNIPLCDVVDTNSSEEPAFTRNMKVASAL